VQGALRDILQNTPQSFFDDTIGKVQVSSIIYLQYALSKVPFLINALLFRKMPNLDSKDYNYVLAFIQSSPKELCI